MFEISTTENKRLAEIFFLIDPGRFHFLKFILEGYDNIAILSSIERNKGIVRIKTSPDSLQDLMILMSHISERINKPTLS